MKPVKTILSIAMLAFSSCVIEDAGSTRSFLINKSAHVIKVVPYLNGSEQVDAIKLVNPEEKLLVFQMHQRGKIIKPSYADILKPYDYVKVIYDNQFTVVHLKTVAQNPKELSFENNRNIMNIKNYEFIIDKETKHTILNHYNFTFTEQDYLNAQ